jgi:hypothetical protein
MAAAQMSRGPLSLEVTAMNTQWKDEFYGPPAPIPAWILFTILLLGLFVAKIVTASF